MFVTFTIGLGLILCVMGIAAEGCVKCCERTENESFQAAINLHKTIGVHTTTEKVEKKQASDWLDAWTFKKMIKKDQLVTFDTVNNVGNNFIPELGIFMAQFNGSYLFYLEATSDNMVPFELGIFRNKLEVGTVDTNKHSTLVITELTEKNAMYVKVKEAQENTTLFSCKFTGYMLGYGKLRA